MSVGRQAELGALASFVEDVAAGPSAMLLEGEPGIGKSTLWSEGVELARAGGHRVLSCRPSGSDAELSFVGLGDLLRDAAGDALADLPEPQREALEVSLLRRPAERKALDPRAVSVATLSVVEALATAEPLVIAIDDVQWLDAASARAITFVVRRLSAEPVAILLASTGADARPPLEIGDALRSDRVRRVRVGPLGAADLDVLVRERVGLTMSLSEARGLADVSGGNPFFALEIARAVARGDAGVTGQALPVPKNLRDDLVMRHVGTLPASSVDLLLFAAAAGRPTLDLLRAAGESDRMPARLQRAIDAGLVQVAGADVRFTHPLYRSVVYAGASRTRRHAIHRRLAELTDDPEERARHLALSAEASDEAIAASLDEAAALARDRGAPDASAELLEHAIRLTPPGRTGDVRRRHLEAAGYRLIAGDPGRAEDHAREAARRSTSGTDRAEALWRIATIELERGAVADARRSLETAAAEPDVAALVSAEVQRLLAELSVRRGDLLDADWHARSAVARAGAVGDPAFTLATRTTALRIALLRGEAAPALTLAPESQEGVSPAAFDALDLVLAEAEIVADRYDDARIRLDALRAAAGSRRRARASRGAPAPGRARAPRGGVASSAVSRRRRERARATVRRGGERGGGVARLSRRTPRTRCRGKDPRRPGPARRRR